MRNRQVHKGVIIQSDQESPPFYIPTNSIDSLSLRQGTAKAWGWDAIVGLPTDVESGVATHETITAAVESLPSGGRILLLRDTITEAVNMSSGNILLQGRGKISVVTGNFIISGDGNIVSGLKIVGDLTLSGDGNFVSEVYYQGTFTDSGSGNDFRVIEEV